MNFHKKYKQIIRFAKALILRESKPIYKKNITAQNKCRVFWQLRWVKVGLSSVNPVDILGYNSTVTIFSKTRKTKKRQKTGQNYTKTFKKIRTLSYDSWKRHSHSCNSHMHGRRTIYPAAITKKVNHNQKTMTDPTDHLQRVNQMTQKHEKNLLCKQMKVIFPVTYQKSKE